MNKVYIATSLDGFIADEEGKLDWLIGFPNPENTDYGYEEFMNTVDAIIMGRGTFDTVKDFTPWPYDKPVFVLSDTLKSIPEELMGKVHLISGSPNEITAQVIAMGYQNLYIDGGKTIQRFFGESLIDELTVSKIPVLLGGGIPLFAELSTPIQLTHKKTEVFSNGVIKSIYIR